MAQAPQTRHSLILRLRNRSDADAWNEFVEIYEPLVYRMMVNCGLQASDAGDQTQEVMTAVANAINRWQPDESRGKFRTWLYRISRNILADFWKNLKRQPQAGVDSAFLQIEDPCELDAKFEKAFRNRIFVLAVEKVKSNVNPKLWKTFWMAAIDQIPAEEIATDQDISVGSVYVAKSRIMKQLKETVQIFLKTES